MPQLNANIPYLHCWVRNAYLFADEKNTELTRCYIFGVKSLLNRPLLFHCQLSNGALYWGLPISAFVHKPGFEPLGDTEEARLSRLQWWDCQSSDIAVTTFAYLRGYRVDCRDRLGRWMRGTYEFTLDGYFADLNAPPLGYAEDSDSKCYHLIRLDNGNYCCYPNTFLRWHNLNHVDPYDLQDPPRYRPYRWGLRSECPVEHQVSPSHLSRNPNEK